MVCVDRQRRASSRESPESDHRRDIVTEPAGRKPSQEAGLSFREVFISELFIFVLVSTDDAATGVVPQSCGELILPTTSSKSVAAPAAATPCPACRDTPRQAGHTVACTAHLNGTPNTPTTNGFRFFKLSYPKLTKPRIKNHHSTGTSQTTDGSALGKKRNVYKS